MKTKMYICLRNVISFTFKWFGLFGLILILPIIFLNIDLFNWTVSLLKRK